MHPVVAVHEMAPSITITEDNSLPVDDDDFYSYHGLEVKEGSDHTP